MESDSPVRRVQRVRHELQVRDVTVAQVEVLSPAFVAVTFAAESLKDFVSDSFDDHVKFIIGDAAEPVRRDYTPRRFDRSRGELTLEFALHAQGGVSDWARQAKVGQTVRIGGPRGSMIIPMDYDWHLLVGDATALPAIARRLEELPADARVQVYLQLDEADRRVLRGPAQTELHHLENMEALVSAVQAWTPLAGEGFVWCAAEASVVTRLRPILLEEKGHPKEAAKIAAYWKQGATDYHE